MQCTAAQRALLRDWLPRPTAEDDKYSRGVLGAVVGTDEYPGAAVLAVEAAWRTGLGMVRLGARARVQELVLHARPETVVSEPAQLGRASAWLVGSGYAPSSVPGEVLDLLHASQVPVVLDAGALSLVNGHTGPLVLTPHAGELARLLTETMGESVSAERVRADPADAARRAAAHTGAVVLLKGASTTIATADGTLTRTAAAPHRLATAGSGDVLAGILGGLLAQSPQRASESQDALSAAAHAAVTLHALAASHAGADARPIVALDVARAVPAVIETVLTEL